MVYCHICKIYLKSMNAFLTHHRWNHNGITTKDYYDIYLKKPGEGLCQTPGCNNECKFATFTSGYYKHCSRACTKKDPEFNNKIVRTKMKTGVYNNNREKSKKTCLKKYGVKNISKIEKVQRKKEKTSLKNNGYKYYVGSDEHKQYMINGGAAHCNSFITNPSKPQVELFKLYQETLPYPIMNYPCNRYSIDIAVPALNLAIEYDGSYWHQDKKYDKHRQEQIENDGWIFLRYIDIVPNREQLIKDIKEVANG